MDNKWLVYQKTLDNIYHNINIYMKMIIYYYKLVIINKHTNNEYIKNNYPKQNITDLDIFNEYIIETKNLGIFTIFNNIPDVIHPLEKEYYLNYGMYISFIKPSYFKKSKKDDIIILDNNIWKYSSYRYPIFYQDVAPYNKYKKYIYLNIKYFNFEKYKNYLIIAINNEKEKYIFDNNIIKKKDKNTWKIEKNIINKNWVYISILRKISNEDILNTFNVSKIVKKDTLIYCHHKNLVNNLYFFSFNKNDYLNDPFKVWYKKGDELNMYTIKVKKDFEALNLTCDILSNNKLTKTEPIETLLKNQNNSNNIYNANLNYIKSYSNSDTVWANNKGKRLVYEMMFKSSNFIGEGLINTTNFVGASSYIQFLNNLNIQNFIYSYGYYEKLNKYYNYEIFHKLTDDEIESKEITKIILDESY
jgi:hypothetical protein